MAESTPTHSDMTEKEFLANYDITQYARPSLTSDIVLLSLLRDKPDADIKNIDVHALQILLIKRASHPFKNEWALPGGFCRPSETAYETAKRELFEETNIKQAYLKLDGVYSNQNRDPRGWIISNAWLGLIDRFQCDLRADTDAWEAEWFTIESIKSAITLVTTQVTEYNHQITLRSEITDVTLTAVITETITCVGTTYESTYKTLHSDLAFDHGEIILQTLLNFKDEIKEDIRPLFNLLPVEFTLGELQTSYELLLGEKSQNFRRKIAPYVTETNKFAEIRGYRPTKLFKRNNIMFKYRRNECQN